MRRRTPTLLCAAAAAVALFGTAACGGSDVKSRLVRRHRRHAYDPGRRGQPHPCRRTSTRCQLGIARPVPHVRATRDSEPHRRHLHAVPRDRLPVHKSHDPRLHVAPEREVERRSGLRRQRRHVYVQSAEEVPRARHPRHLGAGRERQRGGQHVHRDVQAAERAVRRTRWRRCRSCRSTSGRRVADPVKYTDTKPVGDRSVHARHVRADPVQAEEEPELLAGQQGRAGRGCVPGTGQQPDDEPARRDQWQVRLGLHLHPRREEHVRQPRLRPTTRTGSRRAARSGCSST